MSQAIAWGSAFVINPTDVIAPYVYNALDQEERYGVDALRVRVPTGALSETDLGYVPVPVAPSPQVQAAVCAFDALEQPLHVRVHGVVAAHRDAHAAPGSDLLCGILHGSAGQVFSRRRPSEAAPGHIDGCSLLA